MEQEINLNMDIKKYVGKKVRVRFISSLPSDIKFAGTLESSKEPDRYILSAKEGTFFVDSGEYQKINKITFSHRDIIEIEEVEK